MCVARCVSSDADHMLRQRKSGHSKPRNESENKRPSEQSVSLPCLAGRTHLSHRAAEEERKRKQELVEYEKYLLERKKELEREEEERVKKELEYFAKLKKEQDEQVRAVVVVVSVLDG